MADRTNAQLTYCRTGPGALLSAKSDRKEFEGEHGRAMSTRLPRIKPPAEAAED